MKTYKLKNKKYKLVPIEQEYNPNIEEKKNKKYLYISIIFVIIWIILIFL